MRAPDEKKTHPTKSIYSSVWWKQGELYLIMESFPNNNPQYTVNQEINNQKVVIS